MRSWTLDPARAAPARRRRTPPPPLPSATTTPSRRAGGVRRGADRSRRGRVAGPNAAAATAWSSRAWSAWRAAPRADASSASASRAGPWRHRVDPSPTASGSRAAVGGAGGATGRRGLDLRGARLAPGARRAGGVGRQEAPGGEVEQAVGERLGQVALVGSTSIASVLRSSASDVSPRFRAIQPRRLCGLGTHRAASMRSMSRSSSLRLARARSGRPNMACAMVAAIRAYALG